MTCPSSSEYVATRKDGSHIDIYSNQVLIIHLPDGSREMYCIDLDLTETRDLEQELHATTAGSVPFLRHRHWVSSPPMQGQISYANVNFQKLTNRAASELLPGPLPRWFTKPTSTLPTQLAASQRQHDHADTELRVTAGDSAWPRLNGALARWPRPGGYV